MDNKTRLLQEHYQKMLEAIYLVEASLETLPTYIPQHRYTPKEREPFNALCDRFVRAVEVAIKYFRTYDYYISGAFSDTLRDNLNKMEKLHLITSTDLWIDMRGLRNRIVHDYLPEALMGLYQEIQNRFGPELSRLKQYARTS